MDSETDLFSRALREEDLDVRMLRLDGDRRSALRRVHFAEGMLLGFEATNVEQEFHRRRLVRHQHWLHGAGTVLGLAVLMEKKEIDGADLPGKQTRVDIHVTPGFALDAFGREVQCAEPYCIDLIDWLQAQGDDTSPEGAFSPQGVFSLPGFLDPHAPDLLDAVHGGFLVLRVTARHEACPRGLQPVFARRVNDSTDAVDTSRVGDGVGLELLPDDDPESDFEGRPQPWTDVTVPGDDDLDDALSPAEEDHLSGGGLTAGERAALRLRARLVYAVPEKLPDGGGADAPATDLAKAARVLLARVSVPVDAGTVVVDPARIRIDNLVRPFAVPEALLPSE